VGLLLLATLPFGSGISARGQNGAPAQAATNKPWLDTSKSFDERASILVHAMTLEEKVSQLGHTADAVPRLGIPEYNWWNEGLHGVARAGVATVFPQAIGLAATFDDPLLHREAQVIATEFRAKYNASKGPDGSSLQYKGLTVWSPNINIFRDPRWGRGQETYGEDPYLTGRMGDAFITGLQGDNPKYLETVATSKHYAVHSGPEATRHEVNIDISAHDLNDTYLPAFRTTVMDAHADSIMCAYNAIDGQPACANDMLLGHYLRGAWGFNGYVVSDCGAGEDIAAHHKYKPTQEEGVAAAIKAGMDLICGEPVQARVSLERKAALDAVHQGLLSEGDIDRAVTRTMTARFRLGMFDPPSMVPWSKLGAAENDTVGHRALALQAARESLVLLKNQNNLLPLKHAPGSIAVIGPDADSLDALEGNYNGTPSQPVTILAGLKKRFPAAHIRYVQGTSLIGDVLNPVPSTELFTTGAKTAHGLKAEYFNNTDLSGAPLMSRTDANVNFTWSFNGVNPQLKQNYSVRWTGFLVPKQSGDYLLGFTGQDGYRVWVDGKLQAEDWTPHRPSTTTTNSIHLEANHPYPIKIEYFQTVRAAEAKLVWGLPGREQQEAVAAARNADLVVAVMGLSARIEGEEMKIKADGFSGGDRTSLDLPKPQEDLLEAIARTGKPVVLVLSNGSALGINWADAHIPAILEAWYPGESGGQAVAEAIAGDFSPAGRLPVTFYKSAADLPAFEDYSMANRTYRYFKGEALYPFGYGLSYTTFAYETPKVVAATTSSSSGSAEGEGKVISAEVKNVGNKASDEVAQLYLTHEGVNGAALRELRGFQRVHLAPGERKTVTFTLRDRDLSIVDAQGKRVLAPGTVRFWIGGGQPVTREGLPRTAGVEGSFAISDSRTLPE
jgi:beta-glucosidase